MNGVVPMLLQEVAQSSRQLGVNEKSHDPDGKIC
jgi:hypothetical protein